MEEREFFESVSELIDSNSAFVIATVINAEGSTLAKPGFKLIVGSDGKVIAGSLGGGCPESAIIPAAERALSTGTPETLKVHMEESEKALEAMLTKTAENEVYVETFCGGTLSIFIEPYVPVRRAVLIGQGGSDAVEDSLLDILKWSGFSTILFTPTPSVKPEADMVINSLESNPVEFEYRPSDSVIVLTKGEKDIEILEGLSRKDLSYVGLLASRKRSARDRELLAEKGVGKDFLDSIHTPIGMQINAVSPREIALSIVSELVLVSNDKKLKKVAQ